MSRSNSQSFEERNYRHRVGKGEEKSSFIKIYQGGKILKGSYFVGIYT